MQVEKPKLFFFDGAAGVLFNGLKNCLRERFTVRKRTYHPDHIRQIDYAILKFRPSIIIFNLPNDTEIKPEMLRIFDRLSRTISSLLPIFLHTYTELYELKNQVIFLDKNLPDELFVNKISLFGTQRQENAKLFTQKVWNLHHNLRI